jgi:hypothetical protein
MSKADTKYGHLIVTEMKRHVDEAPWAPEIRLAGNGKGGRMLFLDSEVVPGAFYVETVWEYDQPGDSSREGPVEGHVHDHDEVIGFFGTDLERPHDLCGEIEFWIEDEKHILTETCLIFVPKGLRHSPLIVRRTDRPIFEFTTFAGHMYR